MNIPFAPPYINNDIKAEVMSTLHSGWITSGPKVKEFEKSIVEKYGIPEVVTTNSGTSGLILALHWFGVGQGDEVIIPAYTYAATALAVIHTGAKPVMVESAGDFNMAMEKLESVINKKTKAIIPVDIGGWPADYQKLSTILSTREFYPSNDNQKKLGRPIILADAAHSLGASYKDIKTGNLGDVSVFSFHAVKNITTAEGGAVCLSLPEPFNNKEVGLQLKLWTLNGQTKDAFTKSKAMGWKYDIVYPGFKMNMPDVLAAIGLAQFKIYESELLPRRREIFSHYNKAFSKFTWAQLPPFNSSSRSSSCHIYMLRISKATEEQRDKIIELISAKGVAVNVHFIPLPMLSIFKQMGYNINDYPVAYDNYSREITLPLYPQLTDEEVNYVIKTCAECVEEVI